MRRNYDAIVYGATPAGIIAAIALARQGYSPLLIEPGRYIGGMVAGGLCRTDKGNERTVGGLAREYFDRCSAKYNGQHKWYLEPHVFEQVFVEMLAEEKIDLMLKRKLRGVEKLGSTITAIRLDDGLIYSARMFIDCTYEGDLMAGSGVSYIVGRESEAEYGETLAGVQPGNSADYVEQQLLESFLSQDCPCLGGKDGQHYVQIHEFAPAVDENGNYYWGVNPNPPKPRGSGDGLTQSYNFRLTVTKDKANQVPFPKPRNYVPERYALLLRYILHWPTIKLGKLVHFGRLAGNKFDVNNNGPFSTDYVGGNTGYPDGDESLREHIWQDHIDYVQGYFWFLGHDPRVPQSLRDEVHEWGLAKDEFVANDHWPYQLYIREGRRMKGEYVMTQHDVTVEQTKPDAVAMGSFQIDSHPVQRIATERGWAKIDGHLGMSAKPYQIAYRSITPKSAEAENLLVPVCLSASHVACCSLRMEPVYMMLGHAAGLAAAQAIKTDKAVQKIDMDQLQAQLGRQNQILGL